MVEDTPTLSAAECSEKNVVFNAMFAEITENEYVIGRCSHMSCSVLQYYLLSIIFKFNCKSDFTMMKFL